MLSVLLSVRIKAGIAVAAAGELSAAGYRTPRTMTAASGQDRVDALGRGNYRRYDERTATMLGDGAELLLDRWRGDLRRLRAEADGHTGRLRELLQETPGLGPVGSDVFCREAQGIWPELAPYVGDRARAGAARLGLPRTPSRLVDGVGGTDLPRLVAALVRASLDRSVVADVREAAG